jgi:abortive infection Abi-like protein
MPYRLQMLQTLMEAHPDRAARLRVHVEALEASIDREPDRCLERVRALFEATQLTIAPQLGLAFSDADEFSMRNRRVFDALDFSLKDHPDADRVDKAIKKLVGSINGTIGALAELSNIPGMRHGGSLDWSTLQRQHAHMLGGLCDTLISFLFDVAWTRASAEDAKPDVSRYEDLEAFNASLDDDYGDVEIAGSIFLPSKILHVLDPTRYEVALGEWEAEQAPASNDGEEAA